MTVPSTQPPRSGEFPPLPPIRQVLISMDGQRVDTTGPVWRIRVSKDGGELLALNFALLESDLGDWTMAPRDREIVRHYVASVVTYCKASTARNALAHIRTFIRFYVTRNWAPSDGRCVFSWGALAPEDFLAFLIDQEAHSGNGGNAFTTLRKLYRWATFGAQLGDFDLRTALILETQRAMGNAKGAAVRSLDPQEGPLDADEQRMLLEAVRRGAGAPMCRALVMLHTELGLNPHATVRIRVGGLLRYTANVVDSTGVPHEEVVYHLEVPRVKKRTDYREVRRRPITKELGDLLQSLSVGGPDDPLFCWLDPDDPESGVRAELHRWGSDAGLVSRRTREPLRLTPRRLRYTLATEMAREGASRRRIADVLDHRDLQNVEVYIEAGSYVAAAVAKRLDPVLEPLLQRFRGRVVDGDAGAEPRALGRVVPGVAVQLPTLPLDVGGIGVCGRDVRADGLCRLAPPLSCYLCDKFIAFRGAPHGRIADALEAIVVDRLEGSPDRRIALQLTDTLQAVRELQAQIAAESVGAEVAP